MKGGKAPLGYTIVEVMVVLAVSGMMFLIAANFISGKQAKMQFTQGVNEFGSLLQHSYDQVNDGQYTDININCAFASGSYSVAPTTDTSSADSTQGKQDSCMFLGKVFHFSKGTGSDASQKYEVFSLAGGRLTSTGEAITSLAATVPKVIGGANGGLTTQNTVPQNLHIEKMSVKGILPNGTVINDSASFGLAFLQDLGTTEAGGALSNGAQTTSLYYVVGLGANKSTAEATALISGATLLAINRADICITDGTRYSLVTIGANNAKSTVTTTTIDGGACP